MIELLMAVAIITFAFGISCMATGFFTCFNKDLTEKQIFCLTFGGLLLILIGTVGIAYSAKRLKNNDIVVNTKEIPQIDTTITIKNGIADTLYTYHLIKEK